MFCLRLFWHPPCEYLTTTLLNCLASSSTHLIKFWDRTESTNNLDKHFFILQLTLYQDITVHLDSYLSLFLQPPPWNKKTCHLPFSFHALCSLYCLRLDLALSRSKCAWHPFGLSDLQQQAIFSTVYFIMIRNCPVLPMRLAFSMKSKTIKCTPC